MARTIRSIRISAALAAAATGSALLLTTLPADAGAETFKAAPAPLVDEKTTARRETAIFAGGCFWGVEGVFSHVKGVFSAQSGYAGGPAKLTVGYDDVGTGRTGYAESVRLVYDPTRVSYGTLLRVFFSVIADPTTLNYQGPDHGTQYRSALFPTTAEQAKIARAYLAQLGASGLWTNPIVTKIETVGRFQIAEGYHQDFMALHPNNPYIRAWDKPKLTAFKRMYPALYQPKWGD